MSTPTVEDAVARMAAARNAFLADIPSAPVTIPPAADWPVTPECPLCGREWRRDCPQATPQAWDPTRGIRSTDGDRHKWSPGYRS